MEIRETHARILANVTRTARTNLVQSQTALRGAEQMLAEVLLDIETTGPPKVSVTQLCAMMGIKRPTLNVYIEEGIVPKHFAMVNGQKFWKENDLLHHWAFTVPPLTKTQRLRRADDN